MHYVCSEWLVSWYHCNLQVINCRMIYNLLTLLAFIWLRCETALAPLWSTVGVRFMTGTVYPFIPKVTLNMCSLIPTDHVHSEQFGWPGFGQPLNSTQPHFKLVFWLYKSRTSCPTVFLPLYLATNSSRVNAFKTWFDWFDYAFELNRTGQKSKLMEKYPEKVDWLLYPLSLKTIIDKMNLWIGTWDFALVCGIVHYFGRNCMSRCLRNVTLWKM